MKRIITCCLAAAFSIASFAQSDNPRITLRPHMGVNLSDLAGESGSLYHHKTNFTGGLEMEYHLNDRFGLSVALDYSMQGAKAQSVYYTLTDYENIKDWGGKTLTPTDFVPYNVYDQYINLEYFNLPVMANLHLADGLALRAGLQAGLLISAKHKYDGPHIVKSTEKNYDNLGSYYNIQDNCNRLDLAVPVAIAYEFSNGVSFDLRYNIGLSHVFKNIGTRNNVFMLTLGYNIGI